jgi:hypothetical protein
VIEKRLVVFPMYLKYGIWMIIGVAMATPDRVELYEREEPLWTCEDQGAYMKICGTQELPPLISCKQWISNKDEIKWGCSPSENKYWILEHKHRCFGQENCTLHTIATPRSEMSPFLVAMILTIGIIILLNSKPDDFWGGVCVGAFVENYYDDEDWSGTSWS